MIRQSQRGNLKEATEIKGEIEGNENRPEEGRCVVQSALCIVGGEDMTGDVESAHAATVGTRVNSGQRIYLEKVREIDG